MSAFLRLGLLLAVTTVAAGCGGGGDGGSSAAAGPAASGVTTVTAKDYDPSTGASTTVFRGLEPDERVAVVVINPRSTDPGTFEVEAAGFAGSAPGVALAAAERDGAAPGAAEPLSGLDRLAETHRRLRALMRRAGIATRPPATGRLQVLAEPAAGSTRRFYVFSDLDTGEQTLVDATLRAVSAHAYFYLDNADSSELGPDELSRLAETWESTIYPRDTSTFGAEPDSDHNGHVIILFSHLVGASDAYGYFSPLDEQADDGSAPRSNEADVFYVTTPSAVNIDANTLVGSIAPTTLAHEFQHMINFNQHVLIRQGRQEETWVDEGLAMMADDITGFGHTTADVAARIRGYLGTVEQWSLTNWDGDAAGSYGGSYLFFRQLADRFGDAVLGQLVRTRRTGVANVEAATGTPFSALERDWRVALAFDHTGILPASRFPQYHYLTLDLGQYRTDPSGLHARHFALGPGARAQVRANGALYLLAAGAGGDATLTVTAAGPRPITPTLVLVRY